MSNQTKEMICPECGSRALLNLFPNYFAGIWNCTNIDCAASDICDHEHKHIETAQVDFYPTPDIDQSYEVEVYVCDDCLKTIPLEELDPAVDRSTHLLEAF